MTKEKLLELLQDREVQLTVLGIVEEQLGDLISLREYLDKQLDR